MQSTHDEFLHSIPAHEVLTILKEGQWQAYNDTVSSAITNTNDKTLSSNAIIEEVENTSGIDAFRDLIFDDDVQNVLDVGGGKYDCNRNYLKQERNINLLVWDPFNRSQVHNKTIELQVKKNKVDAAVSMSVLNVIPDIKSRLAHIVTVWSSLEKGGKAYFKIWPGEDFFRGTYLPIETESYYQANAFAERFIREIQVVFGFDNVKPDKNVGNLLVAVKSNNSLPLLSDVKFLQFLSKRDKSVIEKLKYSSYGAIFKFELGIMVKNSIFSRTMNELYIEGNRHRNAHLQHAYDKRFGLMRLGSVK